MSLPVALQLYSVREELAQNFEGVIRKVSQMGYNGVELSGIGDQDDPGEMKRIIESYGLEVVSVHMPFADMESKPGEMFDRALKAGCKYVVIPWLDKDVMLTDDQIDHTIERVRALGKKAKEAGLSLLYHNHDFEFRKIDGEYLLDRIYRKIPAEYLKTQLDTCWVRVGGEDPAEYILKYAGRSPIVHIKDYSGSASKGMYGLIGNKRKKTMEISAFSL